MAAPVTSSPAVSQLLAVLTRRKNMLGSVSVAALLLVLRYWLSKDRGTKHVGIESTQDEYDYIVVGGGTCRAFAFTPPLSK